MQPPRSSVSPLPSFASRPGVPRAVTLIDAGSRKFSPSGAAHVLALASGSLEEKMVDRLAQEIEEAEQQAKAKP